MSRKIATLLMMAFTSACASLNSGIPASVGQFNAATAPEGSQVILSTIAEAQIPEGQCGLILWTLDSDRPIPVFRFVSGGEGDAVLGGAPVSLTLSNASGVSGFGVFENLEFSNEAGVSLKTDVEFGSNFDGGNYVQKGLITVETSAGWRSVTPVAGIAGCRAS